MAHQFSLLLVEPETQNQEVVEEVLKSEFEITDIAVSPSSMDAMSLLGKHNDIQCIIISSSLKDSSGFSLITDIRSIKGYSKTPVLLMSDTRDRDQLLKAAASGASDFIVKPFNARALTLKLKKLLADRQFRKTERISTLGAFDVEIEFDSGIKYTCKLQDVSTGGCSVKCSPFSDGGNVFDQATVIIKTDEASLNIRAELARTERDPECEDKTQKRQIVGFQFLEPDEATCEAISSFIANVGQ